ncbi:hypothetical protein GCM10017600_40120 [Streptosporangium carneum]|uniref:Uncharacterized protein n=1 Tax=Streptosporangium carneum TaxID=47481 RepID=A0A9W6I225_9ACTN|nr:hypothetical protein GCM10017600_40120 [Streptosporangium carneum]
MEGLGRLRREGAVPGDVPEFVVGLGTSGCQCLIHSTFPNADRGPGAMMRRGPTRFNTIYRPWGRFTASALAAPKGEGAGIAYA